MKKDTLRHIVADFLMEADLGQDKFTRAYHIGVRGIKELAFDVTGENKTAQLFIQPDGTADLPTDCLKVTKIGILRDGKLRALTRNRDISKAGRLNLSNCDTPCGSDDGSCREKMPENIVGHSGYTTYSASLGTGSWTNIGEYRMDGELVYFDPSFIGRCDVYVEYNSFNDEDELGDMYVHPYAREAVISWIRWKFNINTKTQYKQDKGYYERLWHNEKRKAKYRLKSSNLQEMNQSARQHTKGGLKS